MAIDPEKYVANTVSRGLYDPVSNLVDTSAIGLNNLLPSVIWHITDRCPLTCEFCFATKTEDEVSVEDGRKIINKLKTLRTEKVDIAGGEPLVSRALPGLLDALEEAAIHSTITTSAAASPRMKRWLVDNCARFSRVVFSVDGPESLHDEVRGRPGATANVVKLALAVSNAGGLVRVNSVVTKGLMRKKHSIAELGQMVVQTGAIEWMLIQPHPANEKALFSQHSVSDSVFAAAVLQATGDVGVDAPVRILSRDVARYSQYWLVYPDGTLAQHTKGSNDEPGVNLLEVSIGGIRRHLSRSIKSSLSQITEGP